MRVETAASASAGVGLSRLRVRWHIAAQRVGDERRYPIVMAAWGWSAVAYALFLTGLAAAGRTPRRGVALAASLGYGLAAAVASTLDHIVAQVVLPGACTLGGYWLSALFVGPPQPALERWLLASDRRLFERLSIDRALASVPAWALEVLEFGYSAVYLVIAAGAIAMASMGRDAVL